MSDQTKTDQPQSSAVAIRSGGALAAIVPENIDQTLRLSRALAMAGEMIPETYRDQPEKIMACLMRGMEVGLNPMQSLSSIAVINGRACLWGDAIPALLIKAGHTIDVDFRGEGDELEAVATVTRSDGKKYVRTFSVSDAKRAGLWQTQAKVQRRSKSGGTYEKDNDSPWYRYPKRMLSMRARSWAARDGAADALMGLRIAEEEIDHFGPDRAKDVTPREDEREESTRSFASLAQRARGSTEERQADRDDPEGVGDLAHDTESDGEGSYTADSSPGGEDAGEGGEPDDDAGDAEDDGNSDEASRNDEIADAEVSDPDERDQESDDLAEAEAALAAGKFSTDSAAYKKGRAAAKDEEAIAAGDGRHNAPYAKGPRLVDWLAGFDSVQPQ